MIRVINLKYWRRWKNEASPQLLLYRKLGALNKLDRAFPATLPNFPFSREKERKGRFLRGKCNNLTTLWTYYSIFPINVSINITFETFSLHPTTKSIAPRDCLPPLRVIFGPDDIWAPLETGQGRLIPLWWERTALQPGKKLQYPREQVTSWFPLNNPYSKRLLPYWLPPGGQYPAGGERDG